ncbi:hypothetical protein GCM10025771_08110 [Niveibacterium umoris]|uniref:TnsA endonuclease N-terminal domain-containing protein n=1 Tax=Niveibacterium umoris TaxID=1193620 RepID=A0A840BPN8_9RHOO|nr:hypothetical protein [Niveibacterium umoris]MBB4013642.1 hypothetical protein [Niveibacterium umoris]
MKRKTNKGPSAEVEQGIRKLATVGGRHAYMYDSLKASGIIALESRLERTAVQLADVDPNVRRVVAQPFTLDVETGQIFTTREALQTAREARKKTEATKRDYTPDFNFGLVWREVAVEAKDERFFGDAEYWKKVERAAHILRTAGRGFAVVCFSRKELDALEWNAAVLTSFRHTATESLTPRGVDAIADCLAHGERPLAEVLKAAGLSVRTSPGLFLDGVLRADLKSNRISTNLIVELAHGDLSSLSLLPFEPGLLAP